MIQKFGNMNLILLIIVVSQGFPVNTWELVPLTEDEIKETVDSHNKYRIEEKAVKMYHFLCPVLPSHE